MKNTRKLTLTLAALLGFWRLSRPLHFLVFLTTMTIVIGVAMDGMAGLTVGGDPTAGG